MIIEFEGTVWYWKGPAPHHFVTAPPKESDALKEVQQMVTYGWGMIPVTAWINGTAWTTALFPKDGRFIVPIKASVRRAENLDVGDTVTVRLEVPVNVK